MGKKYNAFKPAYYYDQYEAHLTVEPGEVLNVLELGIHQGGSLRMWMDFFPRARIFGVDSATISLEGETDRIHLLQADQTDTTSIGNFLKSNAVDTLDIVIDDCSHLGFATKQSFWYLFDTFLRPGGYYVIEDWGVGYWETWADGAALVRPDVRSETNGIFASHDRGIPGFVKQVIDQRDKVESMVFTAPFVLVRKQTVENAAAIDRAGRLWEEHHTFFHETNDSK